MSQTVGIQKARETPDLAWDLIDMALQPGPQSCWGSDLQNAMANVNVKYRDGVEKRITPLSEALVPPYAQISELSDKRTDQWNRIVGQ
ncbi:hypothetical protein EDF70_103493 [Neorhizobium sp. JUb45]|nr:hypothetical protein EDF70_103493 [Neorhizobium sp. JUb45]